MNPDVNNNEQFLDWVLENHSLEDACRVVPNLEVELMEAYNNDWCDHCDSENLCSHCGTVSNGDQTIGDHGMCHNCFEHRNDPFEFVIQDDTYGFIVTDNNEEPLVYDSVDAAEEEIYAWFAQNKVTHDFTIGYFDRAGDFIEVKTIEREDDDE